MARLRLHGTRHHRQGDRVVRSADAYGVRRRKHGDEHALLGCHAALRVSVGRLCVRVGVSLPCAGVCSRGSPPIDMGWRGYVYMAHAIIDKATAWSEVQTLTAYDDGNTATNTLYWVATRP
eukprot:Opistho-1_new@55698